ncbi:TetR/AcrR family transcriptional regulator [Mycobacterium conspicuum]|uniref:TetR family transcriptional regulator n=1 Tax=Mycobacterium conspicuum TaxID=44010 RepID=A0A1X1TPB2_9MYCO|nr:TetR/AcrR family transcriptional regulator [Mycobacterium conspicuum]ORV46425.1 TetR family transcriptional regulator [Mycobacterium conspicuum]BBZ40412.1 TetR family transcriptional regulator [Mycobacterium conspicuum]
MTTVPTARRGRAATNPVPDRPAERLLDTATKLFAYQGIRAVGIDLILREANVAKSSLYSSFGSKEALIVAYLKRLDQADRNRWNERTAELTDPVAKLLAFFDLAAAAARARDYRGCLYANAATEFPGAELAPVRAHRDWVRSTMTDLLRAAQTAQPSMLAGQIQILYDGGLVGSKIERSTKPVTAARTLAERLIDAQRQT